MPSCPMHYCNRSSNLSIHLARTQARGAGISTWPTWWTLLWTWRNGSQEEIGRMAGGMFLIFRDIMGKYELRLSGQLQRQLTSNASAAPTRTSETTLHLFVKEPRRSDRSIPAKLRPLNIRIQQSAEYEMIDVIDFMTGMTNPQRHNFLLKMHEGMSDPILSYTWSRGGSRAGVNPHIIWRVPLK